MFTTQDEIILHHLIDKNMAYINDDKRTPITTSEIAQYLSEWYSELFGHPAKFDADYRKTEEIISSQTLYYSITELQQNALADPELIGVPLLTLVALECGYNSDEIKQFEEENIVIFDNAIDGFIIIITW